MAVPKVQLRKLYSPKLTLNAFVARAVTEFPKLKLRDAESYWKLQRQLAKDQKRTGPVRKPRKDKKSVAQRVEGLNDERRAALEDMFYRQHRGTLGVRATGA